MLKHNVDTIVESWTEDDENQSQHWRVRILGDNGKPDILINCTYENDADYIERVLNTYAMSANIETTHIGNF